MKLKACLAAGALLAIFLQIEPAQAQWCAWYDAYTRTCGFRSFEQCLATVSGVGGTCKRDFDETRTRRRRDRDR